MDLARLPLRLKLGFALAMLFGVACGAYTYAYMSTAAQRAAIASTLGR